MEPTCAGSYPTTLGFAPWTSSVSAWRSPTGKRRVLQLIQTSMRRLGGTFESVASPAPSLAWDSELEEAFRKTHVPPDAPLDPLPPSVLEFAEYIAVTYLARARMRSRLAAMRERTGAALTPRPGSDGRELTELGQHDLGSNSAYARFQEAQKRYRTRVSHHDSVPPTRTLPGADSGWVRASSLPS